MINTDKKERCCGCGACASVCPKQCISMVSDSEGFDVPQINADLCVNCGMCENVCPYIAKHNTLTYEAETFVGYSEDKQVLDNSSSGGIFRVIADYWIKNGGVVYAAGYDDEFSVCHMKAEKADELINLQTSKYVQSHTGKIFQSIKRDLQKGQKVMFCGTPCQVVGLRNYIGENENLLLVDLKCHGVPSPLVWKKYLNYRRFKARASKIIAVNFRNKDNSWHNYDMKIVFNNGEYKRNHYLDRFMGAFLGNIALRQSCYKCDFDNSCADITLADVWGGVEKHHRQLEHITKKDRGISLVKVFSNKGKQLINIVSKENGVEIYPSNMELKNEHIIAMPQNREMFFNKINCLAEVDFVKKYMKVSTKTRVYFYAREMLNKIGIINFIRKIKR